MIYFIIGPACAGKSTFIKQNFDMINTITIDVYDFQKEYPFLTTTTVWESYVKCKDALITAITNPNRNGKDIVLEHTLLKRIRREYYIAAIREITQEDITVYCIKPDKKTMIEHHKKRKNFAVTNDIDIAFKVLELPQKDEGFCEVHIL